MSYGPTRQHPVNFYFTPWPPVLHKIRNQARAKGVLFAAQNQRDLRLQTARAVGGCARLDIVYLRIMYIMLNTSDALVLSFHINNLLTISPAPI
jgi:hypothetical protein